MKVIIFAAAFFGLVGLGVPAPAHAQTDAQISIALDTSRAEQGRKQLRRLLREYDLDPWIFTREVVIKPFAVPHSHPVLQLSTKYVNDDDRALSTFLHEQAHWFAAAHDAKQQRAMDELRRMYPNAPESARSPHLHLLINWLELDALAQYVGEERAREVLATQDHYEWMYEHVLQDTQAIGAVLAEHDLIVTPAEGITVSTSGG